MKSFLISAEHASNHVPEVWRSLFAGASKVLDSHRAWDPGSREMAESLASALSAPVLEGQASRLLVDLNRSESHPRLFSEFSRGLSQTQKRELIETYWRPHWDSYRDHLETLPGQIIHIACHSFAPVLGDKTRNTDIGLLYDPSRPIETQYCRTLGKALRAALPDLTIHMNQPYQGVSNGMGQQHRRDYDDNELITLELEINQRLTGQVALLAESIARAVKVERDG
ncbi:MAG TPA: N-formylglutamate amidohydrolase [Wenzhouxiangellaceae bacterium]|nr:N-formylglutamate amidohydrolase [Wenzhouxiangellaceae bacterium]